MVGAVTILESAPKGRSGLLNSVSVLTDADLPSLSRLLDQDPLINAVMAARIADAGTLRPGWLGGTVFGIRSRTGIDAAVFAGGVVMPFGGNESSWPALAAAISARPRTCSSIVGESRAVSAMWSVLAPRWAPARSIRHTQPLLLLDRRPAVASDPTVRRAKAADLDSYVAASADMFTEELGVSPYTSPGAAAYRARTAELINGGQAFARFDARGEVEFKADLGVVTSQTCQIQGVWVRPDLRGRGIATAAMASVIRAALQLAPTVSLYVNDYNVAGLRLYARLGMRRHATMATVLL
jgi:predicted GNAT family acetyltransferase